MEVLQGLLALVVVPAAASAALISRRLSPAAAIDARTGLSRSVPAWARSRAAPADHLIPLIAFEGINETHCENSLV